MEPVYEVECLLKYRTTTHVLVKWKGYKTPTWEPAANVAHLDLYSPPHAKSPVKPTVTEVSIPKPHMKLLINQSLAQRASVLPLKRALILDTPLFQTATHLEAVQFAPADIYIPNFNPAAFEIMKKSKYQVFPCSLYEAIPRLTGMVFSLVWMDYCGRYEGGSQCQPKVDLQRLLELVPLATGALLAFSFNMRQHTGPPGSALLPPLQEIPQMALQAGYHVRLLDVRVYNPMNYLLYEVLRRETARGAPRLFGFDKTAAQV